MGIFSTRTARVLALAALLSVIAALVFSRQSSMAGPEGGVTIWELCASNQGCLTDGRGGHPGWIELTNTGEEAINLKGFTLGDSKRELELAVLPIIRCSRANIWCCAPPARQAGTASIIIYPFAFRRRVNF